VKDDLTVIEVTADTMKAVSTSYSADRIAEKSPVRKPFKHDGKFYISSGSAMLRCCAETAYQIVPRNEFKGTPHWYGERIYPRGETTEERDEWAAQRRALSEGFYHGMLIKHRGGEFVMVGPPLVFVEKEGSLPVKQLALFSIVTERRDSYESIKTHSC